MRHAPWILAVVVAIVALFCLFAGGDDAPPPQDPSLPAGTREAAPAEAVDGERSPATPIEPAPAPAAVATESPSAGAGGQAHPSTTLRLRVRNVANQADVAVFRWRFRHGDAALQGEGEGGHADLSLPPGHGELLIEAPDFQPLVRVARSAAAGEAAATLDVYLTPAVRGAGITLVVHDTALQPITNVRIDTFVWTPGGPDEGWHLRTPLWARRTSAADGRYVLPELAPGEYGIRVLATDGEGTALPMLPFLRRFTLTGDNGFVEDVTLEPGCVPVLELVDGAGRPIDPATFPITALRLFAPGGPHVSRTWSGATSTGTVTAIDTAPATGPVWTTQAVAAGVYTLEVVAGDHVRVQRQLMLRAGERQEERVVVP